MMPQTRSTTIKRSNRYYRSSKISEATLRRIVRLFAQDLTASSAALIVGLTRKSVNDIFLKIRARIAEECEHFAAAAGHAHPDGESLRLQPGAKEPADPKNIFLGIVNREGWIFTEIVPEVLKSDLQAVFENVVPSEKVTGKTEWRDYDAVFDAAHSKYLRFKVAGGAKNLPQQGIDETENFRSFIRRRLQKFNGLPAHTFYLHLKETEYRFNHRDEDIYDLLLRMLKKNPL